MYSYHYYGLSVNSDLILPELTSLSNTSIETPDVIIRQGMISKEGLLEGKKLGPFLEVNSHQLLLTVPDIARFLVLNGNEIIYQPFQGIDEDSIRVFMLGSCTGALLFQRGYLVLHGNAFEIDGNAVICVGHSGAGKSTLAAAMMQRGYRIISDDVCPVDNNGYVIPGMPRIKLWQDSADKLKIDTNGLHRIRPLLKKYNYPLNDLFCEKPLPVKAVYILNSYNESEFKIERILGMNKFIPLRNNTYRLGYLKGMEMDDTHLKNCSILASRIQLSRIHRPRGSFKVNELADYILEDLQQINVA